MPAVTSLVVRALLVRTDRDVTHELRGYFTRNLKPSTFSPNPSRPPVLVLLLQPSVEGVVGEQRCFECHRYIFFKGTRANWTVRQAANGAIESSARIGVKHHLSFEGEGCNHPVFESVRLVVGLLHAPELWHDQVSVDVSEPTEVAHGNLRARFDSGEPVVVDAMQQFAQLTVDARQALVDGDAGRFGELINANFDLRRSISPIVSDQLRMVQQARDAGATAKFPGSGGAIIGTYADEATYDRLVVAMELIGCKVIRPIVTG